MSRTLPVLSFLSIFFSSVLLASDRLPNPVSDQVQQQVDSLPSDAGASKERWIGRETVLRYVQDIKGLTPDQIALISQNIQGVKLVTDQTSLNVSIFFNNAFTLQFGDPNQVAQGKIYAISIPATVQFPVTMKEGVLSITGLNAGDTPLVLKVKMPSIISDDVLLHWANIDLVAMMAHVEVGIMGDSMAQTRDFSLGGGGQGSRADFVSGFLKGFDLEKIVW